MPRRRKNLALSDQIANEAMMTPPPMIPEQAPVIGGQRYSTGDVAALDQMQPNGGAVPMAWDPMYQPGPHGQQLRGGRNAADPGYGAHPADLADFHSANAMGMVPQRNVTDMTASQRHAMQRHEQLMAARAQQQQQIEAMRQQQRAAIQQRAIAMAKAAEEESRLQQSSPVSAGGGGYPEAIVSALGRGVQAAMAAPQQLRLAANRMQAQARDRQRLALRQRAFANRGRMSRQSLAARYNPQGAAAQQMQQQQQIGNANRMMQLLAAIQGR